MTATNTVYTMGTKDQSTKLVMTKKPGSPCTSAEGEKHPTAALTALSPTMKTDSQTASFSTAQLKTSIHNSLFQREYNHGRGHDEMDSVGRNR